MGINIPKTDLPPLLFYIDRSDHCLGIQPRGGAVDRVRRVLFQVSGRRDYKLTSIVPTVPWDRPFAKDFLRGKLAKQCHLETVLSAQQISELGPKTKQKIVEYKRALGKGASLPQPVQDYLDKSIVSDKFKEIGLNPSIAEKDLKGALFLVRSRLLYAIVGYQNSTATGPEQHAIKTRASDGALMIKKEGEWVAVSEIAQEMDPTPTENGLQSKTDPQKYWNYLSPQGLVPLRSMLEKNLVPVEELSSVEMQKLVEHANTYSGERIGESEEEGPRNCVIQIFTNPRKMTSNDDRWWLTNLSAQVPVHAAIRLISSDGKVYSTGFGATDEEGQVHTGLRNYFASANGMPTILDYEEFRKHEGRIVTSIAITETKYQSVLDHLNQYRTETIRFNKLKQNCTFLAKRCLNLAGIPLENDMPLEELVGKAIVPPRVQHAKQSFQKKMPSCLSRISKILLFIPKLIVRLVLNILLWVLGANKGSPLPSDPATPEECREQAGMRRFQAAMTSKKDLVSAENTHFYHSFPLIQWQMRQDSTFVHPYSGKPAMGILPHPSEEANSLKQRYYHKYIDNF